jgi:hypothetical protein
MYSRILMTPCIKECKMDNAIFDFCQPEAVIFVEENIRPAQNVSPRFRSALHKSNKISSQGFSTSLRLPKTNAGSISQGSF